MHHYIGRFAPSPSGPLHQGSLVAALASYLDAKVNDGIWLVRMEDVDEGRTVAGAADDILRCLRAFGMAWDGEVVCQSARKDRYAQAAQSLAADTYGCGCTRREIADSRLGTASDGAAIYPGTCRHGLTPGRQARALRLRVPDANDAMISFTDRLTGPHEQNLAIEVGDFVLKRADGFWAYQLAVVVDDAEQQISHVVRGADLLDSTPRQIYLQHLLGVATPQYLHVPLITGANGEKLSKQNGAPALDETQPLIALNNAARFLGLLDYPAPSLVQFWESAKAAWAARYSL